MKRRRLATVLRAFAGFGVRAGNRQADISTQLQMQKYLEFYYPSGGEMHYEIGSDWGDYGIYMTGTEEGESVNDARYHGYIVARPSIARDAHGEDLWSCLVTPGGEVFMRMDGGAIAATGHREDVKETRDEWGVRTRTRIIQSSAEPVIDDFLDHCETWRRYGTLVATGRNEYRLKRRKDRE